MLTKDYSAQFNEEFYQKSLKMIDGIVEKFGPKIFQQRLTELLKSFPQMYVKDDIVESWLNGTNK